MLLMCCGLFIIANAQVENGGFENWTDNPTFEHPDMSPATFTSSNNEVFLESGLTPCTEVSGTLGSAVRIETMEYDGDIVPGFGITGNTPSGEDLIFSGGFPFYRYQCERNSVRCQIQHRDLVSRIYDCPVPF